MIFLKWELLCCVPFLQLDTYLVPDTAPQGARSARYYRHTAHHIGLCVYVNGLRGRGTRTWRVTRCILPCTDSPQA
eukprot:2430681-Prymnesium_polylepis.1